MDLDCGLIDESYCGLIEMSLDISSCCGIEYKEHELLHCAIVQLKKEKTLLLVQVLFRGTRHS